MHAAERLGAFAAGVALADLPRATIDSALRCIVDVSGVAIAGIAHPTAAAARAHASRTYAAGASTALGLGPLCAPGAAFVNGVSAHVWDFDDTSYAGIAHGSAPVWPAVLAACESASAGGRRALEAFIAGVEVVYALGEALSNEVYWRGWWTTGLLGTIGAAAGASRALGLDAGRTASAIAIAALATTGPRAVLGHAVKPWSCGNAARTGVEAALAAADGIGAPLDAFEHPRGFAALFNAGLFDAGRIDDLGRRWRLVDPGIAFKLYPACSATQAAVEAVDALLRDGVIEPERIERIECLVTHLVAISLVYPRPSTISEAQFSMQFAIGCMLARRRFAVGDLTPESLAEPAITRFYDRVSLRHAPEVFARAGGEERAPEGALVRIALAGGGSVERFNPCATGMPERPMSAAALHAKFRACAEPAIGAAGARGLLDDLMRLPELDRLPAVRRA